MSKHNGRGKPWCGGTWAQSGSEEGGCPQGAIPHLRLSECPAGVSQVENREMFL